jgi:hypothetical protein
MKILIGRLHLSQAGTGVGYVYDWLHNIMFLIIVIAYPDHLRDWQMQ